MNDLQRAARTRKIIYIGLIVGLFTLSMFWRGKLSAGEKLNRWTVEGQANDLELSELEMGDPEIAGSAARVSLVGFRGVVVTTLWSSAIEKQKRNEWPEFELYARLVTRLQPNFITPWLFQGWNITYNVSVENEKLGDMFFFIARGIELLSEGDRLNTKKVQRPGMKEPFYVGSPDLRREIAFFYQNKFTVSDKVTTLRCLMQLTVMKPDDRSPNRILKENSSTVNEVGFRQFCEVNPQLVRRLVTPRYDVTLDRWVAIARTPEEIADFLAVNNEIPSCWEKNGSLKESLDARFPNLPPNLPPYEDSDKEYYQNHPDLIQRYDRFDALLASRAWAQYAQKVVPPPPRDSNGVPYAASKPNKPEDYDRNDPNAPYKYRMPQRPALIIFRYDPARAQTYLAERLQKEGWHDATTTWDPDSGKTGGDRWFPDRPALLKATRNSLSEWQEAYARWVKYGTDNGLLPTPSMLNAIDAAYLKTLPFFPPGSQLPDELPPELADRLTQDDLNLRKAKQFLPQNLHVTNFNYFLDAAQAESTESMVAARKKITEAEALKERGDLSAAAAFASALAEWRRVLAKQPNFHLGERSDLIQEYTFELELKLTNLLKEEPSVVAQWNTTMSAFQGAVPFLTATTPDNQPVPQDILGVVTVARKEVLQLIAEEKALTEIAVQMRLSQLLEGVAEDKLAEARRTEEPRARADVAGSYAYSKRFVNNDLDETKRMPWVRPDVRMRKLVEVGIFQRPSQAPPGIGGVPKLPIPPQMGSQIEVK